MQDLLTYMSIGAQIYGSVTLYTDRSGLRKYKSIENQINNEFDSDVIAQLELDKAELRAEIEANAIKIDMILPSRDTLLDISEGLQKRWSDVSPESEEFQSELTLLWIAESIDKITSPVEILEGKRTRDEIAALKQTLAPVPDNWIKIVNRFNDMTTEELLADLEMTSTDF